MLYRRLVAFLVLGAALVLASKATAVEAIAVRPGTPAVDLLPAAERYQTDSDRLQVSTAAAGGVADGSCVSRLVRIICRS